MTHDQMLDAISALEQRRGIILDTSGWLELRMPGGVAMDPHLVSVLKAVADGYGDTKVTAYEMESINQEFEPVDIELSNEGMRYLQSLMMSHFDLLLVPVSMQWVVLLSSDMESVFFAPEQFLAAFKRSGNNF